MTDLVINWSIIFISGAILWIWEIQTPLSRIEYKARFLKDFGSAVISIGFTTVLIYLFAPVIKLIASPLIQESLIFIWILSLPLWLRLIIAYLVSDLTYYVIHRAMHSYQFLWLTHHWHHSIESLPLWWLSGQRTSFTSQFLFKFVFIWFPLLSIPPEVMIFVMLHHTVNLNWIHLNLKRNSWMRIVEWVYNTPNFHAVHHYYPDGKNLCAMFTFFDRIFGTYVDPDIIDHSQEQFGLDGEPVTVKMIVGI
ncbi:sterol desaturase family protein [Plectonema radiosum NIES-515]|uniref:Sterol desaturase family protein n=1 Tax=Plectonema radiosum NIES-515 TaxID=2986073 RepID=A0ABT3AW33_9CYAN|nr:sterol desaturase family protein [Plectonema radiosum]MCV3213331.1 sterol desaturase family protein [Plectonema radiosum NIES-515]